MTAHVDTAAPPDALARQTIARIRSALDSGRAPSLAQIVELIREVTCKFETISVQGLGEVIGRDLLTMSRVISVAHTLGYNPEGVEISTINQAIHVIGFNKIRNLALSLLLLQNAANDAVAEKRHVAAHALVAGLLAQAVRQRTRPADAEEAFVCAALRNYGRIMLANFLPGEYRQALAASRGREEAAACRARFGLTPLELSAALLEQTRMPRNVLLGLREISAAERASPRLPPELELPVLADFAEALCRLVDDPELDVDQFDARAQRLVQEYGPVVALTGEELSDVLEEIAGTLNMFGALQPGHALGTRLMQRLKLLAFGGGPAGTAASATPADASRAGPETSPAQTTRHFRDPLAAGIAALIDCTARDGVSLVAAYGQALAAVHAGLQFTHTLVFRRGTDGVRYATWLGAGDFFALVQGEELLEAGVRDVFSVCLKRGEDVLIQNPADPKILPFIPDWLRPAAGTQPLALLPVRDERGTVALFCGLRGEPGPFQLSPRQVQQLRSLRQRLSQLEARSQARGQTADAPAAAGATRD